MARETKNYMAVIKQLESGKFLISFPDFEGITTTAETEDSIQVVATNTIKNKLEELKKLGQEIAEPKKISEVSGDLKEGEFIASIPITASMDIKASFANAGAEIKNTFSNINLKDKESIKESAKDLSNKVDDVINNNIKESLPEGKSNILAMAGGVLSIINTLILSVATVKIPFFGKYGIGFFKGLSDFSSFSNRISRISTLLIFSGILFILLAGSMIYSAYKKNKNLLKYSINGHLIFIVIFYIGLYITLFTKVPKDVRQVVSVSYFKVLIYLVSVALSYVSYKLMNDNVDGEESE